MWQCGNVATSDDRSFRLQVVELISKLAIDIGVRLRQRRQLSDDVIDAADDVTVQLKQLQVEIGGLIGRFLRPRGSHSFSRREKGQIA